jgi:hypothetical protein
MVRYGELRHGLVRFGWGLFRSGKVRYGLVRQGSTLKQITFSKTIYISLIFISLNRRPIDDKITLMHCPVCNGNLKRIGNNYHCMGDPNCSITVIPTEDIDVVQDIEEANIW